ncbi:MAG: DNA/RNA nuclease SfsA [Desulfobacter sp.]|nr:DNA/RNA nuclease SfsA [Desulfobacter sp.]WDP87638.1 MAG: DNA/RNA nuclease SfsA [Desulfobacter sp.]
MTVYKGYELPFLIQGRLIKRYKRFLADIELDTGDVITAHCPNSGSMRGCAEAGARVWVSQSDNPKRKLKYTWEVIQTKDSYIGINTQVPNRLVKQAIENHLVEELDEYTRVRSEVKTSAHTRLDLLLEDERGKRCYVEIKNCTLVEAGRAMFPDAVTLRGQKHLEELVMLRQQGHGAVIFYLIQRMDANSFAPAWDIDPVYGDKLVWAVENGVRIITRDVVMDPCSDPGLISIGKPIPVRLRSGSFFAN